MKSRIYKSLIVLVCIISFVDWPVSTNAQKGKAIARTAKAIAKAAEEDKGLFKSCSGATKSAERNVNNATQSASRVNGTRVQTAVAASRAAGHSYNNYQRNNQQSTEYVKTYCPRCNGEGFVIDYEGYEYTCGQCNGSGTVLMRR